MVYDLRPTTYDSAVGTATQDPKGCRSDEPRGGSEGCYLTMDYQLTLAAVARRAEALFGDRSAVSRRADAR